MKSYESYRNRYGLAANPASVTALAAVIGACCWLLAAAQGQTGNTLHGSRPPSSNAQEAIEKIDPVRGLCAIIGLAKPADAALPLEAARQLKATVYFQSSSAAEAEAVREASGDALGRQVFVDQGELSRIHLADNLAGALIVLSPTVVPRDEVLRVLHPGGRALIGNEVVNKPAPAGMDDWSHYYHGPDNNCVSTDELARGPFLTQFIAEPKFSPMPEVTVVAGGRIFKACGNIAMKANQNASLNTLYCISSYNGAILWTRPLREGFLIHRCTMIATPEVLYLAMTNPAR